MHYQQGKSTLHFIGEADLTVKGKSEEMQNPTCLGSGEIVSQWWFGEPHHLQVLVHCVLSNSKSVSRYHPGMTSTPQRVCCIFLNKRRREQNQQCKRTESHYLSNGDFNSNLVAQTDQLLTMLDWCRKLCNIRPNQVFLVQQSYIDFEQYMFCYAIFSYLKLCVCVVFFFVIFIGHKL